jgi:hypothetical protein
VKCEYVLSFFAHVHSLGRFHSSVQVHENNDVNNAAGRRSRQSSDQIESFAFLFILFDASFFRRLRIIENVIIKRVVREMEEKWNNMKWSG